MIHVIAASCDTGDWAHKFKCGWNQPVSPSVVHAGNTVGHGFGGVLIVVLAALVLFVIARAFRGRKPVTSK